MAHAHRRERLAELRAFGCRGLGEAAAQLGAARVDAELASRLRVDEPELARVRQLLLARVADLDGDDVVAAGELQQRPAPVVRAAEVGDDDDERALPRECVGAPDRLAERRRADSFGTRSSDLVPRSAESSADQPAPCPGGPAPSAGSRRRTSRRRAGCRGASPRDRRRPRLLPRRRPCAGRRSRSSSTATCRARAT